MLHASCKLQSGGVPAVHTPPTHFSAPLQRLPSPHAEPSATAVFAQPPSAVQVSVVHGFPSSQLIDPQSASVVLVVDVEVVVMVVVDAL